MRRKQRIVRAFWVWIALVGLSPQYLFSQSPSQLYLFNLQQSTDATWHVYAPQYLSAFNPGGYTNQPSFTPSGDILVSVRKASDAQTDIWKLSHGTGRLRRITRTKANEYSPRITPDEQAYSVLRQVPGDSMDQQVFQFGIRGSGYTCLTPKLKNIGYYAWLDDDTLALFQLEGDQNRLTVYSVRDQRWKRITSAVGRTLWSDGKGSLWYVHKFNDAYWYIKRYNQASAVVDVIVETPGKTEDFAVAPDGTFFMGLESKLYYYHPEKSTGWQECADLSVYGISRITRLAIQPDGKKLALVAE